MSGHSNRAFNNSNQRIRGFPEPVFSSTSSLNNIQNLISSTPPFNSTSSQNFIEQLNINQGHDQTLNNENQEVMDQDNSLFSDPTEEDYLREPMHSVWSEESRMDLNNLAMLEDEQPPIILMKKQEIKMLKKMRIGESSSKCSVCFEHYRKNDIIRELPCKHFFHYKCLKPWFKKSNHCPLCRLNVRDKLREIRRQRGEEVSEDDQVNRVPRYVTNFVNNRSEDEQLVGNVLDELTVFEINSIQLDDKLRFSLHKERFDFFKQIKEKRHMTSPNSLMCSKSK